MDTQNKTQREIKFRAWMKPLHVMLAYEDVCAKINPYAAICLHDILGREDYNIMQYTGLKDKGGKEIYEGDIVVGQERGSGFPPYDSTVPRIIEFRNGCWCFDAGRYDDGDWIRFGFWTASNGGNNILKQLEVIGNIYEHGYLLGGGTEK